MPIQIILSAGKYRGVMTALGLCEKLERVRNVRKASSLPSGYFTFPGNDPELLQETQPGRAHSKGRHSLLGAAETPWLLSWGG